MSDLHDKVVERIAKTLARRTAEEAAVPVPVELWEEDAEAVYTDLVAWLRRNDIVLPIQGDS